MTTQFRLGDGVPRDAVEDACGELGFRLSNVVQRTASFPAQAIFVSPDRLTMLHLIEDEAAGRAVILRGARAEAVTSELLRMLSTGTTPRRPEAASNSASSQGAGASAAGDAASSAGAAASESASSAGAAASAAGEAARDAGAAASAAEAVRDAGAATTGSEGAASAAEGKGA